MGLKVDLKAARACIQSDPTRALEMCLALSVAYDGSVELEDTQTKYVILITTGLAAHAAEDYPVCEKSFQKATEVLPEAPQAWKGLCDCYESSGNLNGLPVPLQRAVEIADSKANYGRARSLRLRLARVLHSLGRGEEALGVLNCHLNNSSAKSSDGESPHEQLEVILHAAVLQYELEECAIIRRANNRVAQEGALSELAVCVDAYRGKSLKKNAQEPLNTLMSEGMTLLNGFVSRGEELSPRFLQDLAARFSRSLLCQVLGRAELSIPRSDVQTGGGWAEVKSKCEVVQGMLRSLGCDDGFPASVILFSSSFAEMVSQEELRQLAERGIEDGAGVWLRAEGCLHLALLAFRTGDSARAKILLELSTAAMSEEDGRVGIRQGPGSRWRELTLECLISEQSGYSGIESSVALSRLDAALEELHTSKEAHMSPLPDCDPVGDLSLARAGLLRLVGLTEDALVVLEELAKDGHRVREVSDGQTTRLRCRALCAAADLLLSLPGGEYGEAQSRIKEALAADPDFAPALSLMGWLLLVSRDSLDEGGSEAARPLLERAAQLQPDSSVNALRLARCYWDLGGEWREDRSHCFNTLLRAAKLDPLNAQAFEWLGYWYQHIGGDQDRARGCFDRAVKLNPEIRGAGEALAALYLQNGQETLALALFRKCAELSVSCHWAWAGLGRSGMLKGELAEAAGQLQQAIRGCPTSWSYWSDLGWCYHSEGKLQAALKAYTRAEELLMHEDQDGGMVCKDLGAFVRVKTQVGTIQRQLGRVDEAVESFASALSLDPKDLMVLEGTGEAYLAQAHARASEGLYTAATGALRAGCEVTRIFLECSSSSGGSKVSCAWKLLGDLYTYGHKIPPKCFASEANDGDGGGMEPG
ncbi:unnamed protein product, partial [Choristocarpus tenellus]